MTLFPFSFYCATHVVISCMVQIFSIFFLWFSFLTICGADARVCTRWDRFIDRTLFPMHGVMVVFCWHEH